MSTSMRYQAGPFLALLYPGFQVQQKLFNRLLVSSLPGPQTGIGFLRQILVCYET